eukprot:scaffold2183_cov140-Isochrysis_galbana.AAC.10
MDPRKVAPGERQALVRVSRRRRARRMCLRRRATSDGRAERQPDGRPGLSVFGLAARSVNR